MDQSHNFDYQITPEERIRGTYEEFTKKAVDQYHIYESALEESAEHFEQERAALNKAMQQHLSGIRGAPLLIAFLIWVKTAPYYYPDRTDYKMILFGSNLIPFYREDGEPRIIDELSQKFLAEIIEEIRCADTFDIQTKERLVDEFCDFSKWLYKETFLLSFAIEDPDFRKVHHRVIPHFQFISFISYLEGKYQLIAKLMYFGGKSLSQILSISVQDIEFSKKMIVFDDVWVHFPHHVFKELKLLINDKTHGSVFAGREAKELNPSTVFRNFKIAAIKAHLGDNFTPKDLYKSKEMR